MILFYEGDPINPLSFFQEKSFSRLENHFSNMREIRLD